MKRTCIALLVMLAWCGVKAQSKVNVELGYRYLIAVKANTKYISSDVDTHANSIRCLVGYHINNYWNVNAGMGLDCYLGNYSGNTIPVVLNVKYSIKGQPQGFFVMAEGGPQVTFSSSAEKGYMCLGAIGYKLKLSKLLRLNFMAGYNYQKSTDFSVYDVNCKRQSIALGVSLSL